MLRLALCLAFLVCGSGWAQDTSGRKLSEHYGFLPVEVTKLSTRAASLIAGDFNDDGRTDLVVANNDKHRLDLLIQRPQNFLQANPLAASQDANFVDNHQRFEHRKIPVDQDVVALAAADLNNDGRTDIAYFGAPDQLVVRFQSDDGGWLEKWQTRVSDVAAGQWCLAAGDVNGDGREDLVLLGKNETLLFLQQKTSDFGQPVRLLNTSDQQAMVQVADLNDDGLDDLCYLAGDATRRSLGVRLQTLDAQLGPEFLFDLERPRAVSVRDVDGDGSAEILTIDSRTGRLKVMKLGWTPAEPDAVPKRLVRYGFGQKSGGRERDLAIVDIDGNGLSDVVVSDPEASRVLLFRQSADRGLDLGTPFPSLTGGAQLRAIPSTMRRPAQLVIHSTREKTVGICAWQRGRLTFPQSLALDTEPVGIGSFPAQGDFAAGLAILTRGKEGRNGAFSLQVQLPPVDELGWGQWKDVPGFAGDALPLKGTPDQILVADVLGDGKPELLVFQGSQPPVVIRQQEDGTWKADAIAGSWGAGTVPVGAVFPGRIGNESGLLVAQENFVRLLRIGSSNQWEVVDQINAGESQSKVVGTALLDLDGQPGAELVMVDRGLKQLRILKLTDNRYSPWKEVNLGDVEFKSLRVADLNGDGRDDLLIFCADHFSVLYAGGAAPTLDEIASYETDLERSFPTDVLAGDLNADGQINLVLTDTRAHYVELLEYRPPSQIERAMYFTVFEEKGFAREEGSGVEPREGLIADVTGDGRADLILLVHDRLLVYPQDSGEPVRTR